MARPQTVSDTDILHVALECFLKHGPGVSTETIAQQLHVSPQALLKRFGTKQQLMMAAVAPVGLSASVPELLSGPDDRPFDVQLTELLNGVAEFFVEMTRRLAVLRWSNADCRELMQRYDEPPPLQDIRLVAEWLECAFRKNLIRRCDFHAIALMLLSALHGPAMLADLLGTHPTGHSNEAYVRILAETLIEGLQPVDLTCCDVT